MDLASSSRLLKGLVCVLLAAAVCGCGLMAKKQEEYVGAQTQPPLKVPPGLATPQPDHQTRIPSPSGAKTAGSQGPDLDVPPIVALESGDIQLHSDGALNWLVIRESEDDAWRQILDFWERNAIALAYKSARLGIMETVWQTENASETPGTAAQKMFRIRLEHYDDTGGTEVFVSNRNRKQVVVGEGVQWVPLPANPVLETDLMNRLLVFLGGDAAGTQKATVKAAPQGLVKAVDEGGQPALLMDKPMAMAWRHVGQAVDRLGYAVVADDRAAHRYMITLGEHPPEVTKKAGWLSRLFFSNRDNKPSVPVYSVNLKAGKDGTVVTTGVDPGTGADPDRARKILDQISGELR